MGRSYSFTLVINVTGGETTADVADEPDQPNVFVVIAFSSTESLNWDGQGTKEDGQFQNR